MKIRMFGNVFPAVALAIILSTLAGCSGQHDRLQRLVTNCLDISGEQYCSSCQWPRAESGCSADNACARTTEVWRESLNYVAIRDKKMCSCTTPNFVHGLVIPRALIAGVESPNRPNGIWNFAWQTALKRDIPATEIALAINPQHDRSENQLHIHITALRKDSRKLFNKELSMPVESLDRVWDAAAKMARAKGLSDYGILVVKGADDSFTVLVEPESPEDLYMLARCPG